MRQDIRELWNQKFLEANQLGMRETEAVTYANDAVADYAGYIEEEARWRLKYQEGEEE